MKKTDLRSVYFKYHYDGNEFLLIWRLLDETKTISGKKYKLWYVALQDLHAIQFIGDTYETCLAPNLTNSNNYFKKIFDTITFYWRLLDETKTISGKKYKL